MRLSILWRIMEIDEGVISRGRRPMRTTPYYKLAQKKPENSDGYWKKSWKEKSSSMGLTFPDTNKEKAKRTFWHWKYFEWLTMDALLQLFNLALVWMMKNIIKLMKLKSLVNGHYLIFNTVMVVTMCRVENEWKQTTLYTKGN